MKPMKIKCSVLELLALSGLSSVLVGAPLTEDFTNGLADWTSTVILDTDDNGGIGNNEASFQVNDENALVLNTTTFNGIDQYAFIRNGAFLDVGEEAQVDITIPLTAERNFGLYVGGTAPVPAVFGDITREDYISCYAAAVNTTLATRGFDGVFEYNNVQSPGAGAETLFIARAGENMFEVGFYLEGERTVFQEREPEAPNAATFVGIYADAREVGIMGAISEFRIVSIPGMIPDIPAPAITITGASMNDLGEFVIDFSGPVNANFAVAKSTTLEDGFIETAATTIPVITSDENGVGQAIVTAEEASDPVEFYRIEEVLAVE